MITTQVFHELTILSCPHFLNSWHKQGQTPILCTVPAMFYCRMWKDVTLTVQNQTDCSILHICKVAHCIRLQSYDITLLPGMIQNM